MEELPVLQIDKKYAILIGINDYYDDIVRSLRYSAADVESFYDILTEPNRGSYSQEHIRLLTDESQRSDLTPLRSNIMSQTSALASIATTKDSLLFYFSGHGIEENGGSFLLPQDSRYNVLGESAVSVDWIKAILKSSKARVKIVILDACHSGAIKGKSASGFMTKGFQEAIFPAPEGFAMLSSCRLKEVSWEDDEMQHSVFSYFLTEGLRGAADYDRDSIITITEANRYTFEKVSSWALANSRKQSPILECSILGDVGLCQVPSDYVPPIPTAMNITRIELESTVTPIKMPKLCGFLLNYVDPDTIVADGSVMTYDLGRLEDRDSYFVLTFNYDEEKRREMIDRIIPNLSQIGLQFDRAEYHVSGSMDLNYLVKACRTRGFKITSFDPSEKLLQIELPSEWEKVSGSMSFLDTEGGVRIKIANPDGVAGDFYDRINPKTLMEFFVLVQK